VLTGERMEDAAFRIERSDREFPIESIRRVLDGELAGVYVADALSAETRAALLDRFRSSRSLIPRTDGVTGHYLGAYHYGQTFDHYMEAVERTQGDVVAFLGDEDNPVARVIGAVRAGLEPSVAVRAARWNDRKGGIARALSWSSSGTYLLAPHDDVGQLTDPRQVGFEAQAAAAGEVIAVNIYPKVPKPGGDLRIWNLKPSADSRARLGIDHTGYPYPEAELEGLPFLDVAVESGGVLISNGGLVHGVTGYATPDIGMDRLLINFFVARTNQHTVLHWV
jgi:hypothetical protein